MVRVGYKHSEETKRKIGKSNTGKKGKMGLNDLKRVLI